MGDDDDEDEQEEDNDEELDEDDIVGLEQEDGEQVDEDDEDDMGPIIFEGTIDHSPDSDSQSRNKTFYCPNCGNCYSAAGSLKLHMRACLRQRNEVSAEERKCKVCSKIFNSVAYLKEHMMRHTGEQPYRCTRCYRKFVDEHKYKTHMEAHKHQDKLEAEAEALAAQHGGKKVVVKEFNCSFCAQSFTVVFDVGQVKRRYACDACRDKYSNAEALRQHKQQVEEKREFSCERCGRKFVFEGFLQRHLPTCDGSIKRRRDMK
ncbi:zinc finger protein 12 [Drosophila busckii]|nr:zinc finger protein 12 [Drosophila busckii]